MLVLKQSVGYQCPDPPSSQSSVLAVFFNTSPLSILHNTTEHKLLEAPPLNGPSGIEFGGGAFYLSRPKAGFQLAQRDPPKVGLSTRK